MTPPTWLFWPVILQPSGTVTATGGTVTDSGGYRYHTFTSSGTLDVTAGGDVEVLLVGGGGGGHGNSNAGGGGGAGGVRLLDGANALALSTSSYTITVGNGGASSGSGGSSSIVGSGVSESVLGGGRGGDGKTAGVNGGSGGGGGAFADSTTNTSGGSGTSGQGNNGGNGYSDDPYVSWANDGGGGGGGAGASGGNGAYRVGGNGGNGITVWGATYGGGGGGGVRFSSATPGLGGSGGGGNGGADSVGAAGTANTGGGGGGGSSLTKIGGAGGSGIVIVRYPIGGTVLWSPSDLASLVAWYKADAITGLSDADPVSTWIDSSGNSQDVTATSTERPIYKTSIQNSLPVVRFDGSDDRLRKTNSPITGTTARTIAIVAKANVVGLGGIIGIGVENLPVPSGSAFDVTPEVAIRVFGSRTFTAGFGTTGFHVLVVACPSSPTVTDVDAWLDGGALTQSTTTGTTLNTSGNLYIGERGQSSSPTNFDGDIAEVVMYNAEASQSDRQKLEGYLAHKWGLTSNLPSTHPYKNSPP